MRMVYQARILFALILIGTAFISLVIFGPMHSFGMPIDGDGEMSNCPFMGAASIGKMDVFSHLGIWKNIFAAIPPEVAPLVFLSAVIVLTLVAKINWPAFLKNKDGPTIPASSYLEQPVSVSTNYLIAAFFQGILHTKIYV